MSCRVHEVRTHPMRRRCCVDVYPPPPSVSLTVRVLLGLYKKITTSTVVSGCIFAFLVSLNFDVRRNDQCCSAQTQKLSAEPWVHHVRGSRQIIPGEWLEVSLLSVLSEKISAEFHIRFLKTRTLDPNVAKHWHLQSIRRALPRYTSPWIPSSSKIVRVLSLLPSQYLPWPIYGWRGVSPSSLCPRDELLFLKHVTAKTLGSMRTRVTSARPNIRRTTGIFFNAKASNLFLSSNYWAY